MASKIEQTIDDIYSLLDNCKYAAFSNKENIVVNREDLYELLEELREHVPEEIKIYQKMIVNRDTILENARAQSEQIIAQARQYQSQMVDQNEIMQQAYAQAGEIVNQARANAQDMLNQATNDANNYQMHAVTYTDDALSSLQDIISRAITSATDRYNDLLASLNEAMDRVSANRAQLSQQVGTEPAGSPLSAGFGNINPSQGDLSSGGPAPAPKSVGDGIDII